MCVNLESKRSVIFRSDKGISATKVASVFKCDRTQINKIIKNKDSIFEDWLQEFNKKCKEIITM